MAVEFISYLGGDYGSGSSFLPFYSTGVDHQLGIVFHGSSGAGNNLSETTDQNAVARERGTWRYEKSTPNPSFNDLDEIQDNYVKNPMIDSLNFDNIWIYAEEIATPAAESPLQGGNSGWDVNNAGLDQWISMGAQTRSWTFSRSAANTSSEVYIGTLKFYFVESVSTPTTDPSTGVTNETYFGQVQLTLGALV